MRVAGHQKRAFVRELLVDFRRRFKIVPLGEYAATLAQRTNLIVRDLAAIPEPFVRPADRPMPRPEPALTVEASRQ